MRRVAGVCALLVAGCLEKNPVFVEPAVTEGATGGPGEGSTAVAEPPTTTSASEAWTTGAPEPLDTTSDPPDTMGPVTFPGPGSCGDGVQDVNEACDDGNLSDADGCTSLCNLAVCGDGLQWAGVEQCDDGDLDNNDECIEDCTFAACGDGHLWLGQEQCDDGDDLNDNGCENDCTPTVRLVFVSSMIFRASDLGGLENADALCQSMAIKAQLPAGVYRAWLSTDSESPNTRFVPTKYKYVRRDGQPIAMNSNDMTDGSLIVPIELDEFGLPGPMSEGSQCAMRGVHSNTDAFGDPANEGSDCGGWTNDEFMTRWGSQISADKWWSDGCAESFCSQEAPIYCFQQ